MMRTQARLQSDTRWINEEVLTSAEDILLGNSKNAATADLPRADLAALYRRLLMYRPTQGAFVVEVIGPQSGVGVTSVVHGLGCIAADFFEHRVLLCDATGTGDLLRSSHSIRRNALERLARFPSERKPGELVTCTVGSSREPAGVVASVAQSAGMLQKVRESFDLVVIDAPPGNSSDIGPGLARHVDVIVIVIEAERTRVPLVAALLTSFDRNGGKVAGVVLNKRVKHIPKWVYRWF